jgi:hypothetical protein
VCLRRWQTVGLEASAVDAKVVGPIAMLARTELPALATFFGGVIAQEVVKFTGACTVCRYGTAASCTT